MIAETKPISRPRRRYFRARRKLTIMRRDGWRCVYCGAFLLESVETLLAATIDHIYPVASGGSDEESNLASSCHFCNQLKSDAPVQSIEEARQVIAERRRKFAAEWEAELLRFDVTLGDSVPSKPPICLVGWWA